MSKVNIIVASFQSLTATSAGGMGYLGYKLSKELHNLGLLKKFVVSSKGKYSTPFPSVPVSKWSKYYLFLLNNIGKYFLTPYQSRYIQEVLFDRFLAAQIDHSVTKLVATTPYLYRTFKKAQKLDIEIFFTPGNPEDNYITQLVKEENNRYQITQNDAYTFPQRLAYYNKSVPLIDHFVLYNSFLVKTYRERGFDKEIITVKGCLKPHENYQKRTKTSGKQPFKVAFLAYTVLLKGLQYLLEAWKDLQHEDMELHIGGPIDKNVQEIIDRHYSDLKNVYYHGSITDTPAFFADKSISVIPSLIDGGPVTALESMYSAVPVVLSENCGIKDLIEEDKSGWIIPIKDVQSIKDRLLEAYRNPEKTAQVGKHAQNVVSQYNMDEFVQSLTEVVTAKR